jgi:hypothetical protein
MLCIEVESYLNISQSVSRISGQVTCTCYHIVFIMYSPKSTLLPFSMRFSMLFLMLYSFFHFQPMQVATFITLLTFTFSAGLHYTDGEEFTWPSFTVTLSGVTTPLSNTTSTPPFLLVNDVAPHSMSLTYNFPANSGWISQQITNFHSVRLDSGRSLQLGFNLAISTSSNSSTQLILSYRRTASDGSTSTIVKVLRFQCTLAYCSSNFAGTTATLSGVVF